MLTFDTNFSHYRIIRSLGSGGMADVYEAEDTRLGRRVALKILPPELGRQGEFIRRFEKEVRAAASLSHPGIVTVFEVGDADGIPFYAMQLLGGGDLCDRISRGIRPAEALTITREIAEAFEHAHARGFIHRDVKPANVMFDERGHAVLTDFGIVKGTAAETRLTVAGAAIGTPRYMSPEQARGQAVDARTDLYSLGVVLFEMLEGCLPYDAPDAISVIFSHVNDPVPRLSADNARYQALIDALMAKNPADRPDSARVLIDLLDGYAPKASAQPTGQTGDVGPLSASPTTPPGIADLPPRKPLSRGYVLLLGGLGGLCLLAVATAISLLDFTTSGNDIALPAPDFDYVTPPEPAVTSVEQVAPVTTPAAAADQAPLASSPGGPAPNSYAASSAALSKTAERRRPTDNNSSAERRTSTPNSRPAADSADPRCDELWVLFGLGQPLSDSQTRDIEQNCR